MERYAMPYDYTARRSANYAQEEASLARAEIKQLRKDFEAAMLRIQKLEEELAPQTLDKSNFPLQKTSLGENNHEHG